MSIFSVGGLPPVGYVELRKAFPNCTCTHDDYDDKLVRHVDCPDHGEKCKKHPGCKCFRCGGKRVVGCLHGSHPSTCPECKRSGYEPPPSHYATDAGFDTWAIWDAYDLDRYTANAVKYLLRAGKKSIAPRLDDLKKARNYIEKAIEVEESKNGKD